MWRTLYSIIAVFPFVLQERLTLKHKNTSKWARRALKRGVNVMDATTKEAMEEQLRLGLQLRQKVCRPEGLVSTECAVNITYDPAVSVVCMPATCYADALCMPRNLT